MRHLDQHKLLTDCQHGFRRRRSCETQLLTLADELIKGLDKGRQLDFAILDFSKAFDRVPHQRLLKKLDHYGIRGKTLEWIRAFLTNKTQKVTVEGVVSESIHVKIGVPQGSVLGPILFLVFINDLPASVQSSSRLFADDCVVYREIRSDKDCQILQDDLQNYANGRSCGECHSTLRNAAFFEYIGRDRQSCSATHSKAIHSTVKSQQNTLGLRSHKT